MEVADRNISVTMICPGPVQSEVLVAPMVTPLPQNTCTTRRPCAYTPTSIYPQPVLRQQKSTCAPRVTISPQSRCSTRFALHTPSRALGVSSPLCLACALDHAERVHWNGGGEAERGAQGKRQRARDVPALRLPRRVRHVPQAARGVPCVVSVCASFRPARPDRAA